MFAFRQCLSHLRRCHDRCWFNIQHPPPHQTACLRVWAAASNIHHHHQTACVCMCMCVCVCRSRVRCLVVVANSKKQRTQERHIKEKRLPLAETTHNNQLSYLCLMCRSCVRCLVAVDIGCDGGRYWKAGFSYIRERFLYILLIFLVVAPVSAFGWVVGVVGQSP